MSLLFNVENLYVKKNDSLESRKYGRLIYTLEMLKTAPDVIEKLYSKVIPISVTYDLSRDLFEVTAICDQFDPVEPAYTIPFYAVNVRRYKRNKGGSGVAYYLDFIKIEEK
jgi:hypothetical protein